MRDARLDDAQAEKHNHRKLTNLITCTTALSMKLRVMLGRATQNGHVMGRVMTKCGPLEKGMGNHFLP